MQDVVKENQLLKGYISSLQKENQARNTERNTLFHEIERLQAEVERLNKIISKHNSKNNHHSHNNERQIKAIKDSNSDLLKEIQIMKSKNSQMSSDLSSKASLISMLKQEKDSLVAEIMSLKELQIQISQQRNKIRVLENQINLYKSRLQQSVSHQQKSSRLSLIVISLQQKLKALQEKYRKDTTLFQEQIQAINNENQQLKSNNKASVQIANLLNAKISLQATVKRLNGKIQWLENNNSEQQKQNLAAKIKVLQAELAQARAFIDKSKSSQLQYQNSSISKDRQIATLQSTIYSLKSDKSNIEKSLRQKSQIISRLQQEVYSLNHLKENQNRLQIENHQLNFIKEQLLKKVNQIGQQNLELKDEINSLRQKQTAQISQISSLREQRERLLKQLDIQMLSMDQAQNQIKLYRSKVTQYSINRNQSHLRPERQYPRQDHQNLRSIVSKLQEEIQELKASQIKSQLFHDHSINNYQSPHAHYKPHLNQMSRQSLSPIAGLSVNTPTDKSEYNKRKWQNLQRKINVLRNQNQTLKKTLFD